LPNLLGKLVPAPLANEQLPSALMPDESGNYKTISKIKHKKSKLQFKRQKVLACNPKQIPI